MIRRDRGHPDPRALVARLDAADPARRAGATRALLAALEAADEPWAIVDLLATTLREGGGYGRRTACALLGNARAAVSTAALVHALDDDDATTRELAADALAAHRADSPRALLRLLAATADRVSSVRVTALAALSVLAPSPPIAAALGAMLAADRHSVARAGLRTLRRAAPDAVDAAAPLLTARDPTERRGALLYLHGTCAALDSLAAPIVRLAAPGTDPYVRRAAVRCLGRARLNARDANALYEVATSDWDPLLRVAAAVALGQLAWSSAGPRGAYERALARVHAEDAPDLALALRAAGPPDPPAGPLLRALGRAQGFGRLDLADALISPHRARELVPGLLGPGVRTPLAGTRLDDAVERLSADAHARVASRFLALTTHPEPALRGAAASFAAHLHAGIETAVAVQNLADSDPDGAVRELACRLLDELRGR